LGLPGWPAEAPAPGEFQPFLTVAEFAPPPRPAAPATSATPATGGAPATGATGATPAERLDASDWTHATQLAVNGWIERKWMPLTQYFDPAPVSRETCRLLDSRAIKEFNLPGLRMMELAAYQAAEVAALMIAPRVLSTDHRSAVVCGRGNNGGDGLVVARYLAAWGFPVDVYIVGERTKILDDALLNLRRIDRLAETIGAAATAAAAAAAPAAQDEPGAHEGTLAQDGAGAHAGTAAHGDPDAPEGPEAPEASEASDETAGASLAGPALGELLTPGWTRRGPGPAFQPLANVTPALEVIELRTTADLAANAEALAAAVLIVDGVLGTGMLGEVRGFNREAIEWMQAARRAGAGGGGPIPVLALDIPSGIDASTGAVLGVALEADVTVTFGAPKIGLTAEAPDPAGLRHAGQVLLAEISWPNRGTR
ncbi:MAG: NAD(P)H-hydrate epimerase, partial [Planctomycetota bacterium]